MIEVTEVKTDLTESGLDPINSINSSVSNPRFTPTLFNANVIKVI